MKRGRGRPARPERITAEDAREELAEVLDLGADAGRDWAAFTAALEAVGVTERLEALAFALVFDRPARGPGSDAPARYGLRQATQALALRVRALHGGQRGHWRAGALLCLLHRLDTHSALWTRTEPHPPLDAARVPWMARRLEALAAPPREGQAPARRCRISRQVAGLTFTSRVAVALAVLPLVQRAAGLSISPLVSQAVAQSLN